MAKNQDKEMDAAERALMASPADAPEVWGKRQELYALARRIMYMLPGDLNAPEALLLAQYSTALDANPFRGEVYAYTDKKTGKMTLVEGYKLLIRWAKRQSNFSDRYVPLGLTDGSIGYRCTILRDDAHDTMRMFVKLGADWQEAYEIASQSAVGIVKKNEMVYLYGDKAGQEIPPPKGWTWDEVARKRSLKNAINRAYGAPSPREMASETWMVDDTHTEPGDWDIDGFNGMSPFEREATAKANALDRERRARMGEMGAEQAYDDLFDGAPPPDAFPGAVVLTCDECGKDLTDYQTDAGKLYTVGELVDIGQSLKGSPVLCGDCLRKLRKKAEAEKAPKDAEETESAEVEETAE